MNFNKILMTLFLSSSSHQLYTDSQIKAIEPIMVTIPAGSFEMGYAQHESAKPVHKVNVPQFSMGQYEVTVTEFRRFIEATNYPAPTECRHELDGWFKLWTKGNWEVNNLTTNEFQPVVCIDWNAATAYTQWLAEETGKPYRLPTEAEWEYAARAGTKTDYFFGNDETRTEVCKYANTADLYGESILQRDTNTSYYNWTSGMQNCADHAAYASIVGMYKPNQFGLYDVVSNVQEMLSDCYVRGYENAPVDGSARIEEKCDEHSIRGGSWHWDNWPSAQRNSIGKDFSGGVDGFRIALDGTAPQKAKVTNSFASALKQVQLTEQLRRDLRANFPDAVTNLTLSHNENSVTLRWDKSKESDVKYYRVYRNDLTGKMFKLLATNLKQTSFTDTTDRKHQYDYTVVAMRDQLQSHYSKPVTTEAGWVSIPAKIEAEWSSDYSGAAISFSSDNERGGFVLTGAAGISDKAIIHYQVDVPKAGNYSFEYRIASLRKSKGFQLEVNGDSVSINSIVDTGGAHEWQTQKGKSIYLKKGKNTLTLKSLDNSWKLNWLALNQS